MRIVGCLPLDFLILWGGNVGISEVRNMAGSTCTLSTWSRQKYLSSGLKLPSPQEGAVWPKPDLAFEICCHFFAQALLSLETLIQLGCSQVLEASESFWLSKVALHVFVLIYFVDFPHPWPSSCGGEGGCQKIPDCRLLISGKSIQKA